MKKLKGIDGKLDDLWSEAVKKRDKYKCRYCHRPGGIQSHHIYSRSKRSTRWSISNGITLCASHHTLNSGFSAHKTPFLFRDWFVERMGEKFVSALMIKANHHSKLTKFEKEFMVKEFEEYLGETHAELLKRKRRN